MAQDRVHVEKRTSTKLETCLCRSRKRDPRGTNCVMMERLGVCVHAPMNSTTLGCFKRFMMATSALNS